MELIKAFILPAFIPLTIKKGETFKQQIQVTDAASTRMFRIVGVNSGASVFEIEGNALPWIRSSDVVDVYGLSEAANTHYVVSGAALDSSGVNTLITTVGAIPTTNRTFGSIKRRFNGPINFTGYTITSECRATPTASDVKFTFTVGRTDNANGIFELSLAAAQTALLPVQRSVYDVKFTNASNEVAYWVGGAISVEPPVTV